MKRIALAVALLLSLPSAASADEPGTPEQEALKYRQALFTVMRWNFVPLAAMARDKVPYDASVARLRASRLFSIARQLEDAFPKGSGAETGKHTEAKAGIWENPDDFKAKLAELQAQTRATREVTRSGDAAAFKAQFQQLAGACKACHDEYRED